MDAITKYTEFNSKIAASRVTELIKWANNGPRHLYDRSTEWKTRRALRIEGAGNKCEKCGNSKGLDAHHLNYDNFGNEKYEDLKILCKLCHTEFHKYNHCHDHIALTSNKKSRREQIELDLLNS